VKNPAGANEVFRTLATQDGDGLDLWMVLNDRIADGRDISWIWDADFETLAPHAGRVVCSGTRAEELALRLKYAGVAADHLEIEAPLERGLDRALRGDGTRTLYALPTYTALLELRDVLASRGHAPPFWE
jgi:UDP-N-acetylmuramyl tripeptide synthase